MSFYNFFFLTYFSLASLHYLSYYLIQITVRRLGALPGTTKVRSGHPRQAAQTSQATPKVQAGTRRGRKAANSQDTSP